MFTAILGPSGSGKTTLLNFLSGRLYSKNLKITGSVQINGKEIVRIDKYQHLIAYVMQDDVLLAMLTPYEAIKFAADMRLSIPEAERESRTRELLKVLGIEKCSNTRVGNALIRGVSGGERKRTSIGVELITNPSLIYLDEPTTGLDSTTALRIVQLLASLAKTGRTVVSTIHQPSSEIFSSFD